MDEKTTACSNQEWLDQVYDKLLVKMKAECARVGTNIPYTTGEDGKYHDITETRWGKTPDGGTTLSNWTNGFWPGMRGTRPPPWAWKSDWRRSSATRSPWAMTWALCSSSPLWQTSARPATRRPAAGACWRQANWPRGTMWTADLSAPGPVPGTT